MYEDSSKNKTNMIGTYLILSYDVNHEKESKLMTFAKSNIDEKSKSAPSNNDFSRIYLYISWQGIKESSFKNNKTLLNVLHNIWYKIYF